MSTQREGRDAACKCRNDYFQSSGYNYGAQAFPSLLLFLEVGYGVDLFQPQNSTISFYYFLEHPAVTDQALQTKAVPWVC